MKNNTQKIIIISVLLLTLGLSIGIYAHKARAAASVYQVQKTVLLTAATSTDIITLTLPVKSGDLIYGCARNGAVGNGPIQSISDLAGNSWNIISQFQDSPANAAYIAFYAANTSSYVASDTISIIWKAGATQQNDQIAVAEISGLATSNVVDASTTIAQDTASSTVSVGPITTTNANDYIGACATSFGANGANWSAGSTYTLETPNTTERAAIEDKSVSSTGSYSATMTMGGGSLRYGAMIIGFKIASGTSPPHAQVILLNSQNIINNSQVIIN